jgi:hypothetical protein
LKLGLFHLSFGLLPMLAIAAMRATLVLQDLLGARFDHFVLIATDGGILLGDVAFADGFGLGQRLGLGTVEHPFGLARLLFHWLGFNKTTLCPIKGWQ